jgi:hypothetical protein
MVMAMGLNAGVVALELESWPCGAGVMVGVVAGAEAGAGAEVLPGVLGGGGSGKNIAGAGLNVSIDDDRSCWKNEGIRRKMMSWFALFSKCLAHNLSPIKGFYVIL